jgi:hypothetical protein
MEDNLFHSKTSIEVARILDKEPDNVERFDLKGDGVSFVDFMLFIDRPYIGSNCIISSGASNLFHGYKNEFVLVFEPQSVQKDDDLNAFLATYLQMYYFENYEQVDDGNAFSVGPMFRNYQYEGVYTTTPKYFHEGMLDVVSGTSFYWLIPVFRNEYDFIRTEGKSKFESYLESNDPNLAVFDRNPLPI